VTPQTRVVITDYPNEDLLNWVRNGGRMLLLSSGPNPFFWRQGRGGTYGGSWITSFSWIRPGIHRRLPITNPLPLPYMHVMPTGTILGLPIENVAVQQDFLAGQFTGWVQHPAIHTVQFRYGKGTVLMTTFTLKEALRKDPTDPIATAMLHDLVDHLASENCRPVLEANY
jgi:hypothetical protein